MSKIIQAIIGVILIIAATPILIAAFIACFWYWDYKIFENTFNLLLDIIIDIITHNQP